MVANITKAKKNVVDITSTSADKSLPYQSISIIIRRIVLVVSPIIALIEDQVGYLLISISHVSFAKSVAKYNYLLELNLMAIAFTTATIENNP